MIVLVAVGCHRVYRCEHAVVCSHPKHPEKRPDFRPSFLKIGPALREHPVLASIPLLALTATAVPRVQRDIVTNLRMRGDATVAKKSFDRPNLKISVGRKPRNGLTGAFDRVAKEVAKAIVGTGGTADAMNNKKAGAGYRAVSVPGKSSIVYCSTKKEVEDISSQITRQLAHQIVQQHAIGKGGGGGAISFDEALSLASSYVKPYHAGLSFGHRSDAHTEFLVGKVAVIVATVAFGMGIDKPDIRRVVHWGPPKTVEVSFLLIVHVCGHRFSCLVKTDAHGCTQYAFQ